MHIDIHRKSPPDWTQSPPQVKECLHDCRGITALPRELVEAIFANLGSRDLVVCKRVTRAWKKIIDSTPILPRAFYRHMHPLAPVPELPATMNRYDSPSRWPSIRHWLASFSELGRTLARELDEHVRGGARQFPERLFFSLAWVLAEAPVIHCRKAYTIEHADWVHSANFSPDGRYVITASKDKTVRVGACIDGQWQDIATLAHPWGATSAYFSPTGNYCVTASWDFNIRIWEVLEIGEPRQIPVTMPHYALDDLPCFSADEHYLVTCPTSNTTEVHQLVNGQWQRQTSLMEGHCVAHPLFHPRDHLLVTVHDYFNVYIWRLVDKRWQNETIIHHPGFVHQIHFSPDGHHLLATSRKHTATTVYIYSSADRAWDQEAALPTCDVVYTTRFSANGNTLVISSYPQVVTIWQFSDNRWQEVILPQAETFTNGRFSPDDNHLVTPTKHKTAIVWKNVDGQWHKQATLHFPADSIEIKADSLFSPHGHHLVTIPDKGDAKIWGMINGTWQEKSYPSLGRVYRGAFSPDGLYFLARYQNTVTLWTFQQGQP